MSWSLLLPAHKNQLLNFLEFCRLIESKADLGKSIMRVESKARPSPNGEATMEHTTSCRKYMGFLTWSLFLLPSCFSAYASWYRARLAADFPRFMVLRDAGCKVWSSLRIHGHHGPHPNYWGSDSQWWLLCCIYFCLWTEMWSEVGGCYSTSHRLIILIAF